MSRKQINAITKPLGKAAKCKGELIRVKVNVILKSTFMVGNMVDRWVPSPPVVGATVYLGSSKRVTNEKGRASFVLMFKGWRSYPIRIEPPAGKESGGPGGPSTDKDPNTGEYRSDLPDKLFRGASGTLVVSETGLVWTVGREEVWEGPAGATAMSPDSDNARIHSMTPTAITIDYRPDFVKATYYGPRSSKGVSLLILHQSTGENMMIGSTFTEFLRTGLSKSAWVSAHYVIDLDGFIVKMVPDYMTSYHAGYSFWRGIADINPVAIGVEIVNNGVDPYTEAQYNAVVRLFYALKGAFPNLTQDDVLGHCDVNRVGEHNFSVGGDRPNCPGPHFRWSSIAARGVGTSAAPNDEAAINEAITAKYKGFFDQSFPEAALTCNEASVPPVETTARPAAAGQGFNLKDLVSILQRDLATIGYSISSSFSAASVGADNERWKNGQQFSGVYLGATKCAVDIFQRHFMERYDKKMNPYFTREVAVALEAVLRNRRASR